MTDLEAAQDILRMLTEQRIRSEQDLTAAVEAEGLARAKVAEEQRKAAAAIPVDRTAVQLTDGSPVPADGSHKQTDERGLQRGYIVLTDAERAKGFVRPFRDAYRHVGRSVCAKIIQSTVPGVLGGSVDICMGPLDHPGECCVGASVPQVESAQLQRSHLRGGCGKITTMGRSLAETYARDPEFYSSTYCATCSAHFPVGSDGEFTWYEMDGREGPKVGT